MRRVVQHREVHGQHLEENQVRRLERDLHFIGRYFFEGIDSDQVIEEEARALDEPGALPAPDHVVRRKLVAERTFDPGAELEDVNLAVGRYGPAFGQVRLDLAGIELGAAVGAGHALVADEALVGLNHHLPGCDLGDVAVEAGRRLRRGDDERPRLLCFGSGGERAEGGDASRHEQREAHVLHHSGIFPCRCDCREARINPAISTLRQCRV